ncbi:MAG: prepilin-type N-terminal cleavage/methylation domain-containing protein [Candidatus Omnitrophica bacterium]|nr:prepilin-type N-terminal cleavage/methylation domain-containing protein [Candidatus Omnitrophota bacterium]
MRISKGFTLTEIMITIVVMGILASITIPNFSRKYNYAYINEAVSNLKMINEANRLYRANENGFLPTNPGGDATDINYFNTNLHVVLTNDSHIAYQYTSAAPYSTYTCIATVTSGGVTYTLTMDNTMNIPTCASAATCPTIN